VPPDHTRLGGALRLGAGGRNKRRAQQKGAKGCGVGVTTLICYAWCMATLCGE
jgi:hypothetical protein